MKRLTIEEFRTGFIERGGFEEAEAVGRIIAAVRGRGDAALREFTLKFDGVAVDSFRIDGEEIDGAASRLDPGLVAAMSEAASNIRVFAEAQLEAYQDFEIEIRPDVFVGQTVIPLERAGVYVPGGRHPLVSSLLMGAIPASAAGVHEVLVCTPPGPDGHVSPAILAAAGLCGVREVYRVGGAQAVAAMAYGTESIRKADKIFGPGNAYVSAAKKCVFGDVGIDFIAGPTELMIIADRNADPAFIAADLVAQAEHDVRATAILATDSDELAAEVGQKIGVILEQVRTADVARESLETRGSIVLVSSIEEAVELANERAPEHLGLFTADAERIRGRLRNFGSLFIGERAAEVFGDYSCGLNHILPTGGAARYTGGLSVRDFLKIQTTLRVKGKGLQEIGPAAEQLARAEGLEAHALSAEVRRSRSKFRLSFPPFKPLGGHEKRGPSRP